MVLVAILVVITLIVINAVYVAAEFAAVSQQASVKAMPGRISPNERRPPGSHLWLAVSAPTRIAAESA